MKVQYLEDFADKLCMFTHRSRYEQEFLLSAAPKGEQELITAIHRVYGMYEKDILRKTARGCWELMLIIRELMKLAGPNCSENEWNSNREGMMECLRACECAMELADRYAPEEHERIAEYVNKCRKLERENRFRILV